MSTAAKRFLVEKLYRGKDPFAFYVANESDVDFQGWGGTHPYLSEAIDAACPQIVVEVGVWKGSSVLTMASRLSELGLNGVVVAIDTWRGSSEHWIHDEWFDWLRIKSGIPCLQHTFMSNVVAKSLQDYVLPLPLDSINAFQVFKWLAVSPDVIHIDAGHDYQSVSTDIKNWWGILRPGGVLICDDYFVDENGKAANGWDDVIQAVDEHVKSLGLGIDFRHGGNKCWITKPM